MHYEAARGKIKSGDLLAWSHRGWRSWYDFKIQMVRFFTRSEYAHVGIAWVVGGRVLVIEAVMPKVRIYPLSKLGTFYWSSDFIPWATEVEERALSYVGAGYSQLEALAAFFGKSVSPLKMQCAKLVYTLRYGTEPALANCTPSTIVDETLSKGGTLVKIEQ